MNVVVLRGVLSSGPTSRGLPSGTVLATYEVTTRAEGGAAESVPVTWFDPPRRSTTLPAGTEVVVAGRVGRRFFRTAGGTASRTEVVATGVIPARQRVRAAKLVEAAIAAAGELTGEDATSAP
jgi:single-strand DNA-binding protein